MSQEPDRPPKEVSAALVLSAGGLFGAYQVGAWKVLEEVVKPDMVIGASIGALNGWLVASHCSPEEINRLWLDPSMGSLIRLKPKPGLRTGYFDPQPLEDAIRKYFGAGKPEIPYYLVIVEVPNFRTRLIRAADVRPEHLLGTCSIYLFYPNVRVNGKQYTDGGLLGHLPLWAAADLGATRIIAIDCMPRMSPWWVQMTISTLHALGPKRRLPKDVHILRPSEPLGDAQSAMAYDYERIKRWIALGERDARRFAETQHFLVEG